VGKDHHIPGYIANPKARVIAVADINEELAKSVAAEFGIKKVFKDYREMLALNELDAVSVCTPPFAHASPTIDAAKAGKHVLCEKPMAVNAEEAERMVKACQKACVKLGICSSRVKFNMAIEKAREYVQSGKLGKVYYVRLSGFGRRGRPDYPRFSKWFLDSSKAGGGCLIDGGCYSLDQILYVLGSPQPIAVSAMTFKGIGPQPGPDIIHDVEEHASLMVRFEDGTVVTHESAWCSNITERGFLLFGTEGGLKVDPFTFYTDQEGVGIDITTDLPSDERSWIQVYNDIDDFVTAFSENKIPKTSGEDGLKVMQIISMAYLSAKLGREVTLKELKTH
jgi:predicted dehydrogenase